MLSKVADIVFNLFSNCPVSTGQTLFEEQGDIGAIGRLNVRLQDGWRESVLAGQRAAGSSSVEAMILHYTGTFFPAPLPHRESSAESPRNSGTGDRVQPFAQLHNVVAPSGVRRVELGQALGDVQRRSVLL